MGYYADVKAIEDEIIEILRTEDVEPLKAVPPENITKGVRTLTDYITLDDFPQIEVSWATETWDGGGGARREHVFEVDVSAWVKNDDPLEGLEDAKILFGAIYDALDAQGDLNCNADFLGEGGAEIMPSALIQQGGWVYVVVGTFNYHVRIP